MMEEPYEGNKQLIGGRKKKLGKLAYDDSKVIKKVYVFMVPLTSPSGYL